MTPSNALRTLQARVRTPTNAHANAHANAYERGSNGVCSIPPHPPSVRTRAKGPDGPRAFKRLIRNRTEHEQNSRNNREACELAPRRISLSVEGSMKNRCFNDASVSKLFHQRVKPSAPKVKVAAHPTVGSSARAEHRSACNRRLPLRHRHWCQPYEEASDAANNPGAFMAQTIPFAPDERRRFARRRGVGLAFRNARKRGPAGKNRALLIVSGPCLARATWKLRPRFFPLRKFSGAGALRLRVGRRCCRSLGHWHGRAIAGTSNFGCVPDDRFIRSRLAPACQVGAQPET